MSASGRARSRSFRESFSKLCRTISGRRDSKDSIPSFTGVDPEAWDHPEPSSDESTECYSTSYNSSHTELSEDDLKLENFLMPSRTFDNITEDEILTASMRRHDLIDEPYIDMNQPFRFLDLPLEIRQLVYKHYFPQSEATIRVKRVTNDSEVVTNNPWHETHALLLTCKEVNKTAREFHTVRSFALDLSRYTVKPGDILPVSDIVSQLGQIANKCSRLIVAHDQIWDVLEPELFPVLRKVEVWRFNGYQSQALAHNPAHVAANFEKEMRELFGAVRPAILAVNAAKLPAGVTVEFNQVIDTLVCVGRDDIRSKHDRLRHVLTYGDENRDGKFTRVEWASKPSNVLPLPPHFQIARHLHDYCQHLEEHEPELLARAS